MKISFASHGHHYLVHFLLYIIMTFTMFNSLYEIQLNYFKCYNTRFYIPTVFKETCINYPTRLCFCWMNANWFYFVFPNILNGMSTLDHRIFHTTPYRNTTWTNFETSRVGNKGNKTHQFNSTRFRPAIMLSSQTNYSFW